MQEPNPEQYNPPLTWRGHLWRTALALLISASVTVTTAPVQAHHAPVLLVVDLALGAVSLVLSFFRRRWPFPVAVLTAAFGGFSASAAGPGTLAAVSVATRRNLVQVVVVGAVGMAGAEVFWLTQPRAQESPWWVNFAVGLAFTIAMLVSGMYIGSRRELLWTLRDRAERAEAQQELRLAQAQANERARIAREMHDVLAHRMSLVAMHAGALAYRTDLPPEEVRTAAELVQTKAHEALEDLRQVLGLLRGSDDGVPNRPQPTFGDVAGLLREAEESGMRVRLTDLVRDAAAVPERVGRTAYRIVQEGLTNARKHAPGTAVAVSLEGSADEGLTVTVRNAARTGSGRAATPGAGLGLVGLAERTKLAGGRLESGRREGAFELRGWLPWQP